MKFRQALGRTATIAALVAGTTTLGLAQEPAAAPGAVPEKPKTPPELFQQAQDEIRDGRFDVAAETLKRFLNSNPTDADIMALSKKDTTVFLKLRNIPIWSDNASAQAEGKKTVEDIIKKAEETNKKFYQDPARIAKFVRNLGESLEERLYAEQQLKLSGDAVVPVMVDALRTSTELPLKAGILTALGKLNPEQLPGFLIASENLDSDLRLGIVKAIVNRPDSLTLMSSPDTDYTPILWYFASDKSPESAAKRAFATDILNALTGGTMARRSATAEIVKSCQPMVSKTATFRSGEKVRLWNWDAGKMTVTPIEATRLQASDYYGLRNLKWALERSPNDIPAQEAFLSITMERAIEKAQFGELASASPDLFQLLAAWPSDNLNRFFERAMAQKQTAVALGLAQVLAARADKNAASQASPNRPAPFVKGLDYPDARVQLACAIGLLRVPGAAPASNSKVIDILRRSASVDGAPAGAKETGRAIIADPNDNRAEKLASQLRGLGYGVEHVNTGKELASRLSRAADVDMVFVDRHVTNLELRDTLTQVRPMLGSRPIFVVASSNNPPPVPFDDLLLRLAVQIAVTETSSLEVPPPFFNDPRKPATDPVAAKAQTAIIRDQRLGELFNLRLARLERLVNNSGLPQSADLQTRFSQRLPQLTYAALAAEYPITPESSPNTFKSFDAKTRVVLANPQFATLTSKLPPDGLKRIIEELDAAITPQKRELVDQMLSRLDGEMLGIPQDIAKDPLAEEQLNKLARTIGGFAVIGESYSSKSLAEELRQSVSDPANLPTSPEQKKRAAKFAVEYLRRIATGEIPGYDVRPAETALRAALREDELADNAIEAVRRIASAESQQDLLAVALTGARPAPLRLKALERGIQHIQNYGKLTTGALVDSLKKASETETDADLKTRFAVAYHLLAGKADDVNALFQKFPLPLPKAPAAPAPAAEPEKKQ
ncbi:MAG: hypothetical protein ACRC8S_06700 [Fimbriiglobus sp.]